MTFPSAFGLPMALTLRLPGFTIGMKFKGVFGAAMHVEPRMSKRLVTALLADAVRNVFPPCERSTNSRDGPINI
jgi:hypothetical protein